MGGLSECALDRHFAAQLRVMGNVHVSKIRKSDYIISQQWLNLFNQASGQEKYARNCLMLLMYGQLREMGRLGKPFTEPRNTQRHLDDVLGEYNGKIHKPDDKADDDALTNMACCGDLAHEAHDNDHLILPKLDLNISSVEHLSQANPSFIHQEVDSQKLGHKSRNSNKPKQISFQLPQYAKGAKGGNNQELMSKIWQSTMQAINRLNNWTGPDDRIDFLSICLQPFVTNLPEMRVHIAELDRHFERMLSSLIEQACERHDKNMMILYDRLFKQQQELQLAKEEHMRQVKHMMDYQNRQKKPIKREEPLMCQKKSVKNDRPANDRYSPQNAKTPIHSSDCLQCHADVIQKATYTNSNRNLVGMVGNYQSKKQMCDNRNCSHCQARGP